MQTFLDRTIFIFLLIFLQTCDTKRIEETYYDTGELQGRVEIVNGLKNGKQTTYYRNGNVKSVSFWDEDSVNGQSKLYFENGVIKSLSNWKLGTPQGNYQKYFENGNLKDEGNYKDGSLHGEYKIYFPGGRLKEAGNYKNGKKHGYQVNYFENGKLQATQCYLNFQGKEQLIGFEQYDSTGTIIKAASYPELIAKKDSLVQGEKYEVIVKLKHPRFDSTRALLGMYDKDFFPIEGMRHDTINARNHEVVLPIDTKRQGENYIRGFLDNYKIEPVAGDTVNVYSLHKYFEYSYYVKEPGPSI